MSARATGGGGAEYTSVATEDDRRPLAAAAAAAPVDTAAELAASLKQACAALERTDAAQLADPASAHADHLLSACAKHLEALSKSRLSGRPTTAERAGGDVGLLGGDAHEEKHEKITPKTVRLVAPMALLLQLMNIIFLTLLHSLAGDNASSGWITVAIVFPALMQITFGVGLGAVVVKMIKQVGNGSITSMLVGQCYLAFILTFGGIAFLLYAADHGAYRGLPPWNRTSLQFGDTLDTFVSCTYYSATCITTTGFGDVAPTAWYSRLIAIGEQLCGVAFTTTVVGLLVNRIGTAAASHTVRQGVAAASALST